MVFIIVRTARKDGRHCLSNSNFRHVQILIDNAIQEEIAVLIKEEIARNYLAFIVI